jgi:hypothetical protein
LTEDPRQNQTEYYKAVFEFHRHLISLSTGSVLLISVFLEKLFTQPKWKALVIVALSSFLLSIIASVITYTLYIENMPGNQDGQNWPSGQEAIAGLSLIVSWGCLLLGLLALSAFTIRNLL